MRPNSLVYHITKSNAACLSVAACACSVRLIYPLCSAAGFNSIPRSYIPGALARKRAVPSPLAQDGRLLADGNRIWDMQARKLLRVLPANYDYERVAFSPDGKTVAGIEGDSVTLCNAASGAVGHKLILDGKKPVALAFRPHSTQLAVGYSDGMVDLWPAGGVGPEALQGAAMSSVTLLVFDGAGNKLAVGGMSGGAGTVAVYNLPNNTKRSYTDAQLKDITGVAINTAGTRLCAANGDAGLLVWDLDSGAVKSRFPHSGVVAFTPDGRTLLSVRHSFASLDGQLTLGNSIDYLDPDSAQRLHTTSESWAILTICPDPTGKLLAAGGFGAINLYDAGTYSEAGYLAGSSLEINASAFSHSGSLMAIGAGTIGANNTIVTVWDLSTARTKRSFNLGPSEQMFSLYFSSQDDVLYAAASAGVHSWGLTDGLPATLFRKAATVARSSPDYYDSYYSSSAMAPDGKRLFGLRRLSRITDVATLNCSKIDIWDTGTQQKLLTFGDENYTPSPDTRAGLEASQNVIFSSSALRSDGARIVTLRLNQTHAEVWDAQSGRAT